MKRNNNDSTQKQIDRMFYENYKRRQLLRIENNTTQILDSYIKTKNLGLVTLVLLNNQDVKEASSEPEFWLITKNKNTEELYRKYKNKEALVDALTFSRTLENLIINDIKNYA